VTAAHGDVVIVIRQAGPLQDRLPVTAAHGDLLRGGMLLMFGVS
jgi:hypothetical protein